MRFCIRWPDGLRESCYSPSLVVTEFFEPGARYTLRDFLDRSRHALTIASERVRVRYGFACSRALAELERIEATGRRHDAEATVLVESFET